MTILYRTPDEHPDDAGLGRIGMAGLNGTRQRYPRPAHGTNAVVNHSRRAAADTYLMLLAPHQDVADALSDAALAFTHLQDGTYIRISALENTGLRVDVVDAKTGGALDAVARAEPGAVLFATPRVNAVSSSITLSSPAWADTTSIANALNEAALKVLDGYPIIFAATADDERLQIESLGFERDAKTLSKARQVAKAAERKNAMQKLAASSAAIHMWVDDEDDD